MEEAEQPQVEQDAVGAGVEGRDSDPAPLVTTGLPPRFEAWRRRSAAGAILTGIGFGLRQVFEVERDEPSIIMQASGDPPTDLSVEAELGGILPADNVVKIRPWLLGAADHGASSDTEPAKADDAAPPGGHRD